LIDGARIATAAIVVVPLGLVILQAVAPTANPLGFSRSNNEPVVSALLERLPATLELASLAIAAALIAGFAFAMLAVRTSKSVATYLLVALHSIPYFWLMLALETLFVGGGIDIMNGPMRWVFPVGMLAAFLLPPIARYFIACLSAKNPKPKPGEIVTGLVVRFADRLPELIAAAILTEILCAWRGEGRVLFYALLRGDLPIVTGFLLSSALFVLAMRLAARAIAYVSAGDAAIDV
jgi:ABC-type dipeptide/oligopeptide/nickel transport system permease component